ncbi:hypothetical protein Q5424_20125 [Conexibacter sp. JD483]|uniref:hypothetical protein n=1 Tax=unclassified Conexibacter TaxID=2627773 RepID=UPI0027174560|nr:MULTISPECIES: hypothetical protein [unclassified Conexibacter]MDO8188951.1 hypothetical protein [Conexibacter sp. CPCC 205706]MDO8201734.1 hypothetical protein [Conexibacter sp. CPCC 205762]MDR9371417.1 hypothetical protein [Conexibacter sp. JD483]
MPSSRSVRSACCGASIVLGAPLAATGPAVADADIGVTLSARAGLPSSRAGISVTYGVLALGRLDATASRLVSTAADPNPANDVATASCTAIASLTVTC